MKPLRQEPEDISSRAITIVVIVATLITVLAVLVAWWMTPDGLHVGARVAPERPAPISGVDRAPLAAVPARSAIIHARERVQLARYQAIDGQRAQIPIVRAMELVAEGRRPVGAGAPAFAAAPEVR